MFQVGEYVVCGSRAVCRVEAIGPLRFKECGGGEYYTLCPPFTSSEEKIYVPVDTALPIRRIVTGREALEALCCLEEAGEGPGAVNPRMPLERYKEMLSSCDIREELKLFRELYRKEQGTGEGRKRLTQADVTYYKRVERLLCDEFSLALGETWERVMERLYDAVSGRRG